MKSEKSAMVSRSSCVVKVMLIEKIEDGQGGSEVGMRVFRRDRCVSRYRGE